MDKTLKYIAYAVGFILAALVIRGYIYPKFEGPSWDNESRSGDFTFSGKKFYFRLGEGTKIYAGRDGYNVVTDSRNNDVYFALFRNGGFIKSLFTVTFT